MGRIILRTVVIDRRIYKRNKKRFNFLSISLFLLSYILYLKFTYPTFSADWKWKHDVSCYTKKGNLTSITNLKPSARSIYFSDPECNFNWQARSACVIESAARNNPNWEVYILVNRPYSLERLSKEDYMIKLLLRYPNINFAHVNMDEFAKGTPAESFVSSGGLNHTNCPTRLTESLLKYLTLYKWGGIFIEKEFIVTKSLSSLARNWVSKQDDNEIGSRILALSKSGSSIAEAAIRLLVNIHKDVTCESGENVIAKVVEQECFPADPKSKASVSCNGLEIYGPQFFYPIPEDRAYELYEVGEIPGYETAHGYCLWTKVPTGVIYFTHYTTCRYAKLAEEHCPEIYEIYKAIII